jgi:hypothetical protein
MAGSVRGWSCADGYAVEIFENRRAKCRSEARVWWFRMRCSDFVAKHCGAKPRRARRALAGEATAGLDGSVI